VRSLGTAEATAKLEVTMNDPKQEEDKVGRFAWLQSQFPALMFAPGWHGHRNRDFDPKRLEKWGQIAKPHERLGVQLLLHIWDPNIVWECGEFDFFSAIRCWDQSHRIGLCAWIYNPFWVTDLK
jgi:hypothetical protein